MYRRQEPVASESAELHKYLEEERSGASDSQS